MTQSCAPANAKKRRVVGPIVKLTKSMINKHDSEWDTLVNAAPTITKKTHKILVPSSIKGRN